MNPETKSVTSPASPAALDGFRIAAVVDDRFEQVELTSPKSAFEAAEARVDIVSRHPQLTGMNHYAPGEVFTADCALRDAQPQDYDALLLPGGVVNSDNLRLLHHAQRFARGMVEAGKPVAVICHGGWLLISAGLVRGRTLTSWPSLQDDYRNAGAHWVDEEVAVDGPWVSSRKPDDLPAFNRAALEAFARARAGRRRAA